MLAEAVSKDACANGPWWPRLETAARRLLWIGVVVAAILAVAGVVLLTLGYDEAWILLGLRDVFHAQHADLRVAPVLSNGGFFAGAHLAIDALAGAPLWMHRTFSVLCLAGLAASAIAACRPRPASSASLLLVAVPLLGAPGTLVLGASAHATVTASCLAILAVMLWDSSRLGRAARWIVCGTLMGLAAGSRLEWLMMFPALLAWAVVWPDGRRARIADALAASVVGAAVLYGNFAWMGSLGPRQGAVLAESVGMGRSLIDYPRLLNRFAIGDELAPLAWMGMSTATALLVVRAEAGRWPCWLALVPCGWLIWTAWVLRSPIPHLRYLWPSIACFAVVAGIGLSRLHDWGRRRERRDARLLALLFGCAFLASGLGAAVRALVLGDSDQLSFEWSRESRMPNYRRFQCIQDEAAAAAHVKSAFGPDESLPTIGGDFTLRLLSGRRVVSLDKLIADDGTALAAIPPRFVITSGVGSYAQLDARGRRWIEDNCRLEAQFGQYCFYRATGAYPTDLRILVPFVVDAPVQPLAAGLKFNTR